MKALILNSGLGKRMGILASEHPKCMTEIGFGSTILGRQLHMLASHGISEIVMTTGMYEGKLVEYCKSLELPLHITFVSNPDYARTNYIYSIYCAREYLDDDILLIHGDVVFESSVLDKVMDLRSGCMVVSSAARLPEKDFKAVLEDGRISRVGTEYFDQAVAAWPVYKLCKEDWRKWLGRIIAYCERGEVGCYAEQALNEIAGECNIVPLDIKEELCREVDTQEDLQAVIEQVRRLENRTVYMCFSTDMLHSGHINIIKKASALGRLTVGVLSDQAVASYKRYPLIPFEERKTLFEHITGVHKVIEQLSLDYTEVLRKLRPACVVHGDDWRSGFQKPVRDTVVSVLAEYGGRLVEYPYSRDKKYEDLEERARASLSIPDMRRGRLRRLMAMKGMVTIMEAHSGITGLIVEKTKVYQDGRSHQFDGMWISSLCDSTAKGKPDIELVDMTSRFRTIDDIMEVTTKPIVFDGDTGGLTEHFVYTVKTLERMGVSAIIIEDKTGLKKNSLFGTEAEQTQASIEAFSAKIEAGKKAQKTKEFMIIARIESLILEKGMEDALQRARAFVRAGADGIMIHSRRKEPDEIFEFVAQFRIEDPQTPLVVVPTSFNTVTEEAFQERGVNMVIYANQLTRSGFPAMERAAKAILTTHRAKEADDMCMPINEILTLVPEEELI